MVTKYHFLGEITDFRLEGKMYKMSLKHSAISESKDAVKSTHVTLEALKGQFEEAPAGQA